MAIQIKRSKAFESLNLTPMIDVLFFLLAFFLIATEPIQNSDREITVKLPSAESAVPMTMTPDELTINIDANGEYIVRGERMLLDRLESVVQQAVIDNPISQVVIIRGDRQVVFQSVVSVLDMCRRLKVPAYKFSTEADKER